MTPTPKTPAFYRAEQERWLEMLVEYETKLDACRRLDERKDWYHGKTFELFYAAHLELETAFLKVGNPPLARAYADLNGQMAAMMEAQRWVSVEERLPEEGQRVLFVTIGGAVLSGKYYRDGWDEPIDFWSHEEVTHWQPLPAPPAQASAGGAGMTWPEHMQMWPWPDPTNQCIQELEARNAELEGKLAEAEAVVKRLRRDQEIAGLLAHPWYGGCDAMGEDGRCAECARISAAMAEVRMRHTKSGGRYVIRGHAELQSSGGPVYEGAVLTVYEGSNGKWWLRPVGEFEQKFVTEEEYKTLQALPRTQKTQPGDMKAERVATCDMMDKAADELAQALAKAQDSEQQGGSDVC